MTDTQEIYKNLTSPRTVYVVMRSEGEYSDREVECVVGFYDKDSAISYIDNITIESNAFEYIRMTFSEYRGNPTQKDLTWEQVDEAVEEINLGLLSEDFPLLRQTVGIYKSGQCSNPMDWTISNGYGDSSFYIEEVVVWS